MCSNSSDNCILCSEETYIPIKEKYNDFVKKTKFIKGKGDMNIYLHNPFKNKGSLWETRIAGMRKLGRDGSGTKRINHISSNALQNINDLRRKSTAIMKPESFSKKINMGSSTTLLQNKIYELETTVSKQTETIKKLEIEKQSLTTRLRNQPKK